MQVVYHFFPQIVNDNDEVFLSQIKGVIEAIDEFAALEISKFPEHYNFRIVPSLPKYNNLLIQELVNFHNLFHIKMDMSKSIKSSGSLTYKINL